MADTTSGPDHDRCVIEGCGRTRDQHASHGRHLFVSASQLASNRPHRADPFRDIKKMTRQDKERATETERILVGVPGSAMMITRKVQAASAPVLGDDVCHVVRNGVVCGKPRQNHRGNIGHTFNGEAREVRSRLKDGEPRPPCVQCGKPPMSHRGRNAKVLGHKYEPDRSARFAASNEAKALAESREEGVDLGPPPVKARPAMKVTEPSLVTAHFDNFPGHGELNFPSLPGPSQPPVLTTRAMIVESIERAIATIDVTRNPIIRELRLKVDVNVEREILTAEAMVCLSMTFGAATERV